MALYLTGDRDEHDQRLRTYANRREVLAQSPANYYSSQTTITARAFLCTSAALVCQIVCTNHIASARARRYQPPLSRGHIYRVERAFNHPNTNHGATRLFYE